MSSSSIITTTDPAGDGENPIITSIHPDIIKSHILNKLDGATIASTSCAAAQLLNLCSDDRLWKDICNSTWPSTADFRVRAAISAFSSGHKSFYSDSFPTLRHQNINRSIKKVNQSDTSKLISAVDIYYEDKLIYSQVIETETVSPWFLTSPFQVDLLGRKESVKTSLEYESVEGSCMECSEGRLRVSWILIDPVKKRAVNIASSKCVEARRHWLTDNIKLRYATVVETGGGELVQCSVVVTCGAKEGEALNVRDVSMQVEDVEGKIVNGMDSLVILNDAMEGQRCKSCAKLERHAYERFLRLRVEDRERKTRRERSADLACIAAGVPIFFAIWVFLLSR